MAGEAVGSATARESYIAALNYFGETEDTRSGLEKLSDFGTTAVLNGIGGPVFDHRGDVVGIAVGVRMFRLGMSVMPSGVAIAVPGQVVCDLMGRL